MGMIIIFFIAVPPIWPAEPLKLAYVEWSSSIAGNYLIQAVLEHKLGKKCELISMTADEMWKAVASKKADAMISAWLPDVHGHYYREVKEKVVNLGPNLEGTKTGLDRKSVV